MASVGNSKAMIGVIFLQYCSYAIFYLVDEIKNISPEMYKALIKSQEDQRLPGFVTNKLQSKLKDDKPNGSQ